MLDERAHASAAEGPQGKSARSATKSAERWMSPSLPGQSITTRSKDSAACESCPGLCMVAPMATMVGDTLSSLDLGALSILLPFIVAAGLKTAIGSSTVAIITTASLVSHLLPSMGLADGYGPALTTLAIASGSMMLSHVNDSYFWVITQLSSMTVAQGYRLITVASAIAGVTGIVTVVLLRFVLL